MEAVKINISQGKYPKESFTGVLKSIFPSETKGGKGILKIQCEDESEFMVTGLSSVTQEATPGFMGVGKFLDSLLKAMKAAGIKEPEAFWQYEGDTIMAFTTQPDYAGAKCSFKCTPQKKVGTEETEYPPEWTVERYEARKQTPGKLPAQPQTKEYSQDMAEKWKEILVDMPEAMNEAAIMKHLKTAVADEKQRKALNDCRKVSLETLVKYGFLSIENGKYQVV